MKTNKGFTLIELLVVIAIIGILSSVVLVSLNSARGKGQDAKIKATVSGMRAGFEVFADGATYIGATSSDPLKAMFTSLTAIPTTVNSYATTTGYVVAAKLNSSSTRAWCVDSLGNASEVEWSSVDVAGDISDSSCL